MDKKGQAGMGVPLAVGAIVGVVILAVIFTFLVGQTSQPSISESLSVTKNATTQLSYGGIHNNTLKVENESKTLTRNVDYNLTNAKDGTVVVTCNGPFVCINKTTGVLTFNYTYTPSGYVASSTSRTLIGIIPVLLAILILLFVVGFMALKR